MANPEHVKIVLQGAAAIADWQRQNPGASLNLSGADLTGANLAEAHLAGADLTGANLRMANLPMANLTQANLVGADLTGAYLFGVHLNRASLAEADLRGANLRRAHLAGADLSKADLFEAGLIGADLLEAGLRGADLFLSNLVAADLRRADFTGANLFTANLAGGNLSGANLTEARLRGANLFGANLAGVNFARARLGFTSLGNCDLSGARGLSLIKHEGPSSVGVDTLIASFRGAGDKLTPDLEAFFLGAGVPRELLAELPRIVAEVKYYSCFICYGQPDLNFATRLCDDLERNGVSCWLYDLDKTPGERTWPEISQARREADKMVVICSVAALIRDGALKEIEEQIDEDPDKLIPISRDDIWTQTGFRVVRGSRDLGPWLRDRNYADFSDASRYEEALQGVLKALRRKTE